MLPQAQYAGLRVASQLSNQVQMHRDIQRRAERVAGHPQPGILGLRQHCGSNHKSAPGRIRLQPIDATAADQRSQTAPAALPAPAATGTIPTARRLA